MKKRNIIITTFNAIEIAEQIALLSGNEFYLNLDQASVLLQVEIGQITMKGLLIVYDCDLGGIFKIDEQCDREDIVVIYLSENTILAVDLPSDKFLLIK